jgi:hypothetical protein
MTQRKAVAGLLVVALVTTTLWAIPIEYPVFVVSLLPLYTKEELIWEPALLGTWIDENNDFSMTFTNYHGNSYELAVEVDEERTLHFDAQLGKVGEALVLDMYTLPESTWMFLVPVHFFLRIEIDRDELRCGLLDANVGPIEQGEIEIGHVRREDYLVLTESGATLQAFLQSVEKEEYWPLNIDAKRKQDAQ